MIQELLDDFVCLQEVAAPSTISVSFSPLRHINICTLGRVENRKSWKITKLQVDPINAHKNKTICMI